jgi:hypothetical protein
VRDGRLLLDCRTLSDDEAQAVAEAVAAARASISETAQPTSSPPRA